jgi:NitT/TauT family transport system substrate-binding protein
MAETTDQIIQKYKQMRNRIIDLCTVLVLWMSLSPAAHAESIVLAVPGPGTVSYLPIYLAKAIGADQTEGLELKLRYFSGGPLAMRDMMNNNSDFLAIGLPAIAAARADDTPVVAIGQLSQSAMYVFLVRSSLKNKVRNISQLKGRRIGTSSSTSTQRSMGHMMTQYLIKRAGLDSSDVQFISTGQSREAYVAALKSASIDAIMGDEPFASELVAQGLAVRLADLYAPGQSSELLGGTIVHAALATREDVYARHPETVKKVRRMLDLALQWMNTHTAREVVDKLASQPGFHSANSRQLVDILQRNQGMFPERIDWDPQAVTTTERFFHSMAGDAKESDLPFSAFVRGAPQD